MYYAVVEICFFIKAAVKFLNKHKNDRNRRTKSAFGQNLVRMFIRDLITTPGRTIIFSFKRTFSKSPLLRYNVLAKEDFTMKEQKRFLKLSEFEWRLLIKCLNEARSLFLDNGKPVEDIDELLIKAFKMKHKKVRI